MPDNNTPNQYKIHLSEDHFDVLNTVMLWERRSYGLEAVSLLENLGWLKDAKKLSEAIKTQWGGAYIQSWILPYIPNEHLSFDKDDNPVRWFPREADKKNITKVNKAIRRKLSRNKPDGYEDILNLMSRWQNYSLSDALTMLVGEFEFGCKLTLPEDIGGTWTHYTSVASEFILDANTHRLLQKHIIPAVTWTDRDGNTQEHEFGNRRYASLREVVENIIDSTLNVVVTYDGEKDGELRDSAVSYLVVNGNLIWTGRGLSKRDKSWNRYCRHSTRMQAMRTYKPESWEPDWAKIHYLGTMRARKQAQEKRLERQAEQQYRVLYEAGMVQ